MAQLEPTIRKSPQQEPLPLCQQSPDLNVRPSHDPVAIEGKEAPIRDFLSLGGSKSTSSSVDVAQNGSQSSMTTQDLLQPLQKTAGSNIVVPATFVLSSSEPPISSVDYNAGQPVPYNLVNGGVEMQPNYRSSDISCVPKAHGPQGVSNNKHWPQQQKKRLSWIASEDDDDDDDESFDHGYNSKKDIGYQKVENAQQPEGKIMDSKGLTPRSKHSATEQRRRSKINDRFQMLRQLLPNSDQKRDKASFLLEVIEHIQMLHDKVKKYEAAEPLGQLQERPKALPWDRTSGCKEGVTDVSYGPSLMYNVKNSTDANGYMRCQSSPLRAGHMNGNTQIELMSSKGQPSVFANRFLQVPTCLSSYGNNALVSTPAFVTFATPASVYGEEPLTPTLFPSSSQSLPEARTMFAQLVHQQEQAALRVKRPYNREEAIASPDLRQAGKSMLAQKTIVFQDTDCEKHKSPEHRQLTHGERRANEEMQEQSRSSPVSDMHQGNIIPMSRDCKHDKGGLSYDIDGILMDANVRGPKEDCRGEILACSQGATTVLSGTVSISSPYSQGLVDSLTRALQRSGVDLTKASISVQIDLGKPSGSAPTSSTETATQNATIAQLQNKDIGHSQELERPTKRPKIEVDS